jgi:hypothetical protein
MKPSATQDIDRMQSAMSSHSSTVQAVPEAQAQEEEEGEEAQQHGASDVPGAGSDVPAGAEGAAGAGGAAGPGAAGPGATFQGQTEQQGQEQKVWLTAKAIWALQNQWITEGADGTGAGVGLLAYAEMRIGPTGEPQYLIKHP